jgi:NAD-dependent SIR2 family protein deacetylase
MKRIPALTLMARNIDGLHQRAGIAPERVIEV